MDAFEIGLAWGTVHRAGLAQMIELAGRHGFPTIEVPPHIYFAARDDGLSDAALRRRLADAGTRVQLIDCVSKGMPGMPPRETQFDGKTISQYDGATCIAVAEALGAPVLNVSLYHSVKVPVAEMAEAVGALCRQAGQHGMAVALEFYPESGIDSLATAHAIARACGEPNCGVLFDSWHHARNGGTVEEIVALPAGSVTAIQLSDRTEPPPGTPYVPMSGRKLPGEGELPLHRIVAALAANSPGVPGELEVFSQELTDLPLDAAAARAAAAIKAWRAN
jgi:sugar phosphate isomerase/epimerase